MQTVATPSDTLLALIRRATPKGASLLDQAAEKFTERRRHIEIAAKAAGWTIERTLLVLTFGFTVAGFIFGVGVQWERTTKLEATVEAQDKATAASLEAIRSSYLPREVYNADKVYLREAIDRLTAAVERKR